MSEQKKPSAQQKKAVALRLLRERLPEHRQALSDIDERLLEYFVSLARDTSARKGDPGDIHNYYEILGGLKFLRLMDTYDLNANKVRFVIRLREGEWCKEGTRWKHVRGGLKQDGTRGMMVYRWEPFQIFILASVFGFRTWVDTGVNAGERELQPTEEERDGHIYDYRRLCTDFTFYGARKNDKTGLSAFIQLEFFLFEDNNAQVYCLANSGDQAHQLYDRTRDMLRQLDPKGQKIRNTATVCDWLPTYKNVHNSTIKPLTAGPKSKDGLITSLACIDEYGSAPYLKGKSDMKKLVDVVESGMASRREPLSFTTTTAGRISEGPFIEKLSGLHQLLEREIHYGEPDADGNVIWPDQSSDRTLCLCLEPDLYERDEEFMLTSRALRRKVCPMLGIVVQQSYYDNWVSDIRAGIKDAQEYITKNLNVYKSETQQEWISPERVRSLQVPLTIDQCTAEQGWLLFVGMDFSLGDDLHALTYLATRQNPETGMTEFFADMDAWMTEHSLRSSALRGVFERWIKEGWLHVSPGETLQPELPITRIAELAEKTDYNIAYFLYDPYRATAPINGLKAYVADLGVKPDDCVLPCRQNYATFNPLVLEVDYMVKNEPPLIHFSQNPLWPWEAGNMVLDVSTDGMENKKPVKRNGRGDKIDNWICLLMAEKGYDIYMAKLTAAASEM